MRGYELLDKMALIDLSYLEAADVRVAKKNHCWIRWGALAACLCLIVGFVMYECTKFYERYTEDIYCFCLDESYPNVYMAISNETLKQLGLQSYKIKKADIGEKMGVTSECQNEKMNGRPVYHFAKYPDKDFICIVDAPSGYAFYTAGLFKGIRETETVGTSSDLIFEAYGLPESIEKTEIYTGETYLFDIADPQITENIFALLSGKSNIGSKAYHQHQAQVWYEAYGNDDIVYDPQTGTCGVRTKDSDKSLPFSADESGSTVAQNAAPPGWSVYEKARALWNKDMRTIVITTVRGYRININYFPSTRIFNIMGGYYELSEEESETFNDLLQINQ